MTCNVSERLIAGRPDRVGLCFVLEGQRRGREPGLSPIYKKPIALLFFLPTPLLTTSTIITITNYSS